MGLAVVAAATRLAAALAHLSQGGGQDRLVGSQTPPPGVQHAADLSRMLGDTHRLFLYRVTPPSQVRSFPYWKRQEKQGCEEKSCGKHFTRDTNHRHHNHLWL